MSDNLVNLPTIISSNANALRLNPEWHFNVSFNWHSKGFIQENEKEITKSSTKCRSFGLGFNMLSNRPYKTYHGRTKSMRYNDVIMSATASQITSLTSGYSAVYSGADQRKHQSSGSLAFVRVTGEFPTQRASNAENVSISWRYHVCSAFWQACHHAPRLGLVANG